MKAGSAMTTTNDCLKCNGSTYIARYSHIAGGKCFSCGRKFGGSAALHPVVPTRAFYINELTNLISASRSYIESGDGKSWLEDAVNPEYCATLVWALRDAPADVSKRAVAAFARMGLDVSHVATMAIDWACAR